MVLQEEHNAEGSSNESHVEDEQITTAQHQAHHPQIHSYPEYENVDDNELSDPGSFSLNHTGVEDDFQPEGDDYAFDLEVLLNPISSGSG